VAEQKLFWEALESHFQEHWDHFMTKQDHQVMVRLFVRAWDRTYRVTHDEEIVYEGMDRDTAEKWLSGAAS
jgi:hypothetical protein